MPLRGETPASAARQRVMLVLPAGGAILVALAAWLALGRSGGETGAAAGRAAATATVERRDLVESETVDGTLGYSGRQAVVDRLGGTITRLPRQGQVIRRDGTLFEVDGRPVVLMYGPLPAWRRLAAGVPDGHDVRQLERNLAALGHAPGTVDGHYDAATAAAVRRWQAAHDLPRTGAVELGRVAFLPGARRISAIKATLGSSAGQGGGGGGAGRVNTSFATTTGTPRGFSDAPVDARGPSGGEGDGSPGGQADDSPRGGADDDASRGGEDSSRGGQDSSRGGQDSSGGGQDSSRGGGASRGGDGSRGGQDSPRGGADGAPPAGSSRGSGDGASTGSSSGGVATEILETTSTRRVVTVKLDADKQQLAREGRRAQVELPDGRVAAGRIASVGRVARRPQSGGDDSGPGGDGDGAAQITVTIRLTGRGARTRLDQAPVTVDLARETRRDALSVPISALQGAPGGGYIVRVVRPGGTTEPLRVRPGLFADGYVEVAGAGLREGMRVAVPSQ